MSEASDFLDNFVLLMPNRYRNGEPPGPGQVVLNMSAERRELLRTLKSSDWDNVRVDTIWGHPPKAKRKGRWGL